MMMKKLLFVLIALLIVSSSAWAATAPDVKISGYENITASRDVIGVVAATPNGYLAQQLSQNTARPCGLIQLCSPAANTAIYYGGSNVNAVTKTGALLNKANGVSCDMVYVNDVQKIYVSKDMVAVTPTVSWACYY
jgi:uncharacterized protein YdbL (DUF1318 family)